MIDLPDISDQAEEKRQNEIDKRRARADADVIRKIMMTRDGRDWMYRFLGRCNIFGSTFFGEETHNSAFAQGQENIGKQLWLEVQAASLDLYVKMVKEQREEEERLAKVRRADAKAAGPEMEVSAHMIDLPAPEGWKG